MKTTKFKKILRRFPRKTEIILCADGKEYPVAEEDISATCDQDGHWKIKLTIQEKNLDKVE